MTDPPGHLPLKPGGQTPGGHTPVGQTPGGQTPGLHPYDPLEFFLPPLTQKLPVRRILSDPCAAPGD